MTGTYTVSDHLLDRLGELGVGHVFGVPGDYTLTLLDHVVRHRDLRWVGCTNELNAGYAADGYGRMRGIAALLTTFGVGELSAINAITGSYAEHVPVVHVVGGPSSGIQSAQRIVHHSLGDGEFTQFLEMHERITCARAALTAEDATAEIDRVLTTVRDQHLPGYLLLPSDVGEAPASPPQEPLPPPGDITDANALAAFTEAAGRLVHTAGGPAQVRLLVGLLVHRLGATPDLERLLAAGPLLHASTPWAKGIADESNPYFLGIYAGRASHPDLRAAIEEAAVLVVAGVLFTDLNSGFFTQRITRGRTIELGATTASVGEATFGPVSMPAALRSLAWIVEEGQGAQPRTTSPLPMPVPQTPSSGDTPLTQSLLWQAVASHLRPGDTVVAEQGTSFYGMAPHRLPARGNFIGQPLWASIGYTLPAALGACLAEPDGRGVLLIGDGAAQMTVQELSTVLREGVRLLAVVVDNDGYTVERAIHGPEEPYNDIPRWDWERLPDLYAPGTPARSHVVRTAGELEEALDDAGEAPG
ncbi:MAG: alpha-keto acid decarboxylase family protein, partial [Candidatus Dormibacteraceae bacterium]